MEKEICTAGIENKIHSLSERIERNILKLKKVKSKGFQKEKEENNINKSINRDENAIKKLKEDLCETRKRNKEFFDNKYGINNDPQLCTIKETNEDEKDLEVNKHIYFPKALLSLILKDFTKKNSKFEIKIENSLEDGSLNKSLELDNFQKILLIKIIIFLNKKQEEGKIQKNNDGILLTNPTKESNKGLKKKEVNFKLKDLNLKGLKYKTDKKDFISQLKFLEKFKFYYKNPNGDTIKFRLLEIEELDKDFEKTFEIQRIKFFKGIDTISFQNIISDLINFIGGFYILNEKVLELKAKNGKSNILFDLYLILVKHKNTTNSSTIILSFKELEELLGRSKETIYKVFFERKKNKKGELKDTGLEKIIKLGLISGFAKENKDEDSGSLKFFL